MTKRRPRQPAPRCTECSRVTAYTDLLCRPCRSGVDPLALPPGRWVPDGRGTVVFRASSDGLPVRRVA